MGTRPVTVHVAVCDLCGCAGAWCETPADAAEVMLSCGWARQGDRLACDRCAADARSADCKATFGEHAWINWPHVTRALDSSELWSYHPFTQWVPEKDGKPSWRMRQCGSCEYAEHQDEGSDWVGHGPLER